MYFFRPNFGIILDGIPLGIPDGQSNEKKWNEFSLIQSNFTTIWDENQIWELYFFRKVLE